MNTRLLLLFALTLAISACKPKVDETSRYPELISKADNFARNGKTDSALVYFKQAHAIDTSKFEPIYGMGFCYAQKCTERDTFCDEAITYLQKAVAMQPNHKSAYYNLFMAYFKEQRLQEALIAINQCIGIDSTVSAYYRGRASLCLEMKDTACGCQNMNKAIDLGESVLVATRNKYCGNPDSTRVK